MPSPRTPAATQPRTPAASSSRRKSGVVAEHPDAPPAPLVPHSEAELQREVKEIARSLKLPLRAEDGWQQRNEAMRRLHALLLGGAAQTAGFGAAMRDTLREPLAAQLSDLRSKCVKTACAVIAQAARSFGRRFRETADHLLPHLLRLLHVTAHVVNEAADACLREVLSATRAPSLLPPVLHGATSREHAAASRWRCTQYVELALGTLSADQVTGAILRAIRRAILCAQFGAQFSAQFSHAAHPSTAPRPRPRDRGDAEERARRRLRRRARRRARRLRRVRGGVPVARRRGAQDDGRRRAACPRSRRLHGAARLGSRAAGGGARRGGGGGRRRRRRRRRLRLGGRGVRAARRRRRRR